MHGYLRMRIAQFLTVVHPNRHTIYLSRHGQSEYNVQGKIGGNPPLSLAGEEYARRLGDWAPKHVTVHKGRVAKARLWTSSLQRTILTAVHIPHPLVCVSDLGTPVGGKIGASGSAEQLPSVAPRIPASGSAERLRSSYDAEERSEEMWEQMSPRVYRNLDEIFAGEYEGMRYDEIKALAPSEAHLRSMDKIGYRCDAPAPAHRHAPDAQPSRAAPLWRAPCLCGRARAGTRAASRTTTSWRGSTRWCTRWRALTLEPTLALLPAAYLPSPMVRPSRVAWQESYHEPVLIVSHQAVLRMLYTYLKGNPRHGAPKVEIPLHTVMKITWDGWHPPTEERFELGPEAMKVDDGQKNL